MKKILLLVILSALIFCVSTEEVNADISSYCQVPPYVIQDVPANIMFLVDNSGSQFNIAYACTNTLTTAAGTSTKSVPVVSVSGFKVGQSITINPQGATTMTQLWITAIDSTNNILTVGAPVTFSQNYVVTDRGCWDPSTIYCYYNFPSSDSTACNIGCPSSTTASCNNPGTYPTTTVSKATSNKSFVCVTSTSGFSANESIVIGSNTYTISSIPSTTTCSGSSYCGSGYNYCLSLSSNVTTTLNEVVQDSCYPYSQSGGNIAFVDVSGFTVGEPIVVVHGGTPYTTTITALNTTGQDYIQVSPTVTVSKNDPIYDYNCYYYQTPYPEMSFIPTNSYYGYFNSAAYYTYTSSRFQSSRNKSAGAKNGNEYDGNFLNWLTMRRTDEVKKALTGGYDCNVSGGSCASSEGTGYGRLRGIRPDYSFRGIYKAVANAENYISCNGTACPANTYANFTFSPGSSDPSPFTVYTGAGTWTSQGTYNADVRVRTPVQGVIQGTIGSKARIGLANYNSNEGGNVAVNVSGTSMSSVVSSINSTRPTTNTPLAEALWSIVGYFAQQTSMLGGPGPRYNSGDFSTGNAYDPLNYGTSTSPFWPSCSQSYVILITDGEPCADGDLPSSLKDYAAGKSVFNCQNSTCPALTGTAPDTYVFPAETLPSCSAGGNVAGLEDVALYMHTTDLRSSISGTQNLTLYPIYAFGQGSIFLRYAAINGGFVDLDGSGTPNSQAEWWSNGKIDANGYALPDNYYEASDGAAIEQSLNSAISTMLKRASSGTAASVLASGQGSGANLVQAVFYPRRQFGNDVISWTGENQNLWFYIDPFFQNSTIREDTVAEVPNRILNLVNDYIVTLYYDTTLLQAMAQRFKDVNGNGTSLVPEPTITLESLSSIWKAGSMLWSRNLTTLPRTIYTPCITAPVGGTCVSNTGLMPFSVSPTDNSAALAPYIKSNACSVTTTQSCTSNADCPSGETCVPNSSSTGDITRAKDVIMFLHGYRTTFDGYSFDYNPTPPLQIVDRNGDGEPDYRMRTVSIGTGHNQQTNIWKLGDVINSTPKISSWIPLNAYYTRYNDATYNTFTTGSYYVNRGMVFTGGNDGMLHAFKLGKLTLNWTGQGVYDKAELINTSDGYNIGDEKWAFIPKNALPYLAYIADPNYCHFYTVDLTPVIFDASIGAPGSGDISASANPSDGSSWRTVLIGGMRWGGSCRKLGTACNSSACSVTTGTSCTTSANCPSGETCVPNCVNTPMTDPASPSKGLGYSSYFALDITDQNNPVLLWEYAADNLGFATTGPSIVRIGNKNLNGKWFAVIGSGPTGPLDTNSFQFLGRSDQPLQYYVLDLKTGTLMATITPGVANAFAGSLFDAAVDTDYDYQDDAVYAGYVKKCAATSSVCTAGTWTDGGIGVILTNSDPNPTNWKWRTIMDGIGPVTSAVVNLQDTRNKNMWLYFGTGRYYYEQSTTIDDQDSQRYLIGVKDPCFNSAGTDLTGLKNTCTTTRSLSDLTAVNLTQTSGISDVTANGPSFKGWYIQLDPSDGLGASCQQFRAERVVTDTLATTSGNVIFTTYKPYCNLCAVGGKSFEWAVRYNTGNAPGTLLKGLVLLQTSTGAISSINLANAFTLAGNRKSAAIEGYSSERKPSLIDLPPPVNKPVHTRER